MGHFDCWASRFGETVTALELAPEGTGYRARTRFAKSFNLPELMALFKEIADIKTADQLDLPTPEVEYHTIVSKPTEHQKALVKELSKRAEKVHSGSVDAHIANILKHWRDGEADRLTQLVFSDISTPTPGKAGFNVYNDIKKKLIAAGDPRIKERMELDVEVSRLRIMKADYQSKKFRLEDNVTKHFPAEIKNTEALIAGIRADMETLKAHPHPEDGFAGMKIHGRNYLEKDKAGPYGRHRKCLQDGCR